MARDADATARLVALVMERLDLEGPGGPGKLARAIGMPPYSEGSVSLIRRWMRGAHQPSAEYMVEMLSKAGLLTPEADRAWRGETDPAAELRAAAEAAQSAEEAAGRAAPEARPRREKRPG